MPKLLILLLLFFTLSAKEISPLHTFKAIGYVSDFIVTNNKLFAASDEGIVTVFDLQSKKIVDIIKVEPIVTDSGELQPPRLLNIDYYKGKLLLVSIGKDFYRNVWIYENHRLKKIIGQEAKLTIKEARFIDDEKILLATFASEILLHDKSEHYNVYNRHVTQSALGDIVLTKDKKSVIMSDESGEIRILDVASGQTLQVLASENVDNVFHVAHANGITITAGQDRRVAVYQEDKTPYHLKSDFFVYCVGITPSGKTGIYSSGVKHKLQLFSTQTKQKLDKLSGHTALVNQIKFINEKELYSSENSPFIYYWKIP